MKADTKVAYDLAGAATAVECSPKYLIREIKAGRLRAKKLGEALNSEYRIAAKDLAGWFDSLPDA